MITGGGKNESVGVAPGAHTLLTKIEIAPGDQLLDMTDLVCLAKFTFDVDHASVPRICRALQ
jgi:hypothetical protein